MEAEGLWWSNFGTMAVTGAGLDPEVVLADGCIDAVTVSSAEVDSRADAVHRSPVGQDAFILEYELASSFRRPF